MNNQYITLSSRAFTELYSQNTANKFTAQLILPLDLTSGDYEIALVECILMFKSGDGKETSKAEEKVQMSCLLCNAVRPRRFLETYLPILRILKPGSKTAQLENWQYVDVMPGVYSDLTIELLPLTKGKTTVSQPSLPPESVLTITVHIRRKSCHCHRFAAEN